MPQIVQLNGLEILGYTSIHGLACVAGLQASLDAVTVQNETEEHLQYKDQSRLLQARTAFCGSDFMTANSNRHSPLETAGVEPPPTPLPPTPPPQRVMSSTPLLSFGPIEEGTIDIENSDDMGAAVQCRLRSKELSKP